MNNNIYRCKIKYKNKKYDLTESFQFDDDNEIKLIGINNITV